jgi:carbamoyl-phosphate synthase small subunit
MMKNHLKAKLILEDGSIFNGFSFGHPGSISGEIVFNTGMVGYPQSLTDPSYTGQILVFTFPLLGNYGVSDSGLDKYGIPIDFESSNIHIKAMVVSEYCSEHNHWNSKKSLETWLKENNVPAIFGVDTRALTIKIREKGVMLGKIIIGDSGIDQIEFYDPNKDNLVAEVSRKDVLSLGNGKYKIIVVDCGMKNNILRNLLKKDVTLKVVPWNYDFNKEEYDGLFISNGPGDPIHCQETIQHIKKAMELEKPIFGICLGHQLLALASGAKTYKLKYGHRGQNQPCVRNRKQGYVTSQNHGYAVDKDSLPDNWDELFFNANDGTNEGIKHSTLPFFSVQFHPEGSCGPNDTVYLFDEFIELIEKAKNSVVENNSDVTEIN